MENYIVGMYNGHNRKLYEGSCAYCKSLIFLPKSVLQKPRYCGNSCSVKACAKPVTLSCYHCKKEILRSPSKAKRSKSGLFFCDRECKESAQSAVGGVKEIQPPHYTNGLTNYRKRALAHYGSVCAVCKYSEKSVMLDVHHRDSDRSNNALDNLEVLCVWCHAIETRKDWPQEN